MVFPLPGNLWSPYQGATGNDETQVSALRCTTKFQQNPNKQPRVAGGGTGWCPPSSRLDSGSCGVSTDPVSHKSDFSLVKAEPSAVQGAVSWLLFLRPRTHYVTCEESQNLLTRAQPRPAEARAWPRRLHECKQRSHPNESGELPCRWKQLGDEFG